MDTIQRFNIEELPSSSFNLFLGKRRSGKSYLCEHMLRELIDANKLDCAFLISNTGAGFDIIEKPCRYDTIEPLNKIIENYTMINEYNKCANEKDKIRIRTMVVIDDCAVDLKSKSFQILEALSTNGRHIAYEPCALHICILCQSLTKIPRVVRLNSDLIVMNAIASMKELEMVLDENFYVTDTSRDGKKAGRQLYTDLVTSEDFIFIVVENHKQNVTTYADYLKTYKAPAPPAKAAKK